MSTSQTEESLSRFDMNEWHAVYTRHQHEKSVALSAPLNVTAGVNYWIALLGVSGNMVRFRDDGTACNSSGSSTGLNALQTTWISTATWQSCPASVYGSN